MRKIKVGKITLALVLIALGILLTLRNTYDIDLHQSLKLLAGVSIICFGLEIFWLGSKRRRSEEDVKFSVSVLSVVLIAGLYAISYLPMDVVIENGTIISSGLVFFEDENTEVFEFDKSYEQDFTDLDTLDINNDFGVVHVESTQGDKIRIESHIKVTLLKDDQVLAEKIADEAVIIKTSGDSLKLSNKVPEKDVKVNIDYTIYVPEDSVVNVDNNYGETFVKGVHETNVKNSFGPTYIERIASDTNVTSNNGKIELKNIGGPLNAENKFGDIIATDLKRESTIANKNGKIEVVDAKGKSVITNEFGNIILEDVINSTDITSKNGKVTVRRLNGSIDLDGSFTSVDIDDVTENVNIDNNNGTIEVKHVKGELTINNKFSRIDATDINGVVDIDSNNGNVNLDTISSDVKVSLEFGSVHASGLEGTIDMELSNGNVDIDNSDVLTKDVNIESKFGSVSIQVPENQEGEFDLNTKFGKINTPFDFTVTEEINKESNKGAIGSGGQQFIINVSNGNITIK